MSKTARFNEILESVASFTEIHQEFILSDNRAAEVVDARCFLVKLLSEEGFYPSQISKYMDRTEASIRYLLASYSSRISASLWMEKDVEVIRKHLENKSKIIGK